MPRLIELTVEYTRDTEAAIEMPYRILCNGVKREGVKISPDLASEFFYCVSFHKIRYGIILGYETNNVSDYIRSIWGLSGN
jgi:hypothetical protein